MVEATGKQRKKKTAPNAEPVEDEPSAASTNAAAQQEDAEEEKEPSQRMEDIPDNQVSSSLDNVVINTSEQLEIVSSFDQLGIPEQLLRGMYAYGFNKPSAVQQRAILPIIRGRDVIVQSQSGTGKTCVFTLGALQTLDLALREP